MSAIDIEKLQCDFWSQHMEEKEVKAWDGAKSQVQQYAWSHGFNDQSSPNQHLS